MRSHPRKMSPIGAAKLEEMALAYVARFATTRARLEDYMRRKLRERGWDGEGDPPIAALAEKFCEAGYVDDAAYARMKAGSLLRRGYGARRVGQALHAAGVDEDVREDARPSRMAGREAALAMARKRRFGPFGSEVPDRARREKQLAAMLRAGHGMDSARAMIDAGSVAAALEWVAEAEGED